MPLGQPRNVLYEVTIIEYTSQWKRRGGQREVGCAPKRKCGTPEGAAFRTGSSVAPS